MYVLNPGGISVGVKRESDGANIPADIRNSDWRDFLEWQAKGNVPAPYVRPQVDVDSDNDKKDKKQKIKDLLDNDKWNDLNIEEATRLLLKKEFDSMDTK
jgi:hypothetical protein